jgi:hypothetical protein
MTTTPDTAPTVHVDVPLYLPLDGGGTFRVSQGIGGIRTDTEGLVVFPALTGLFEMDESRWYVTHVGTGRRIPVTFNDQEHATTFANAAGPLAAWWEKQPQLSAETTQKLIQLAQEHDGRPDQHVLDAIARRAAKES